MSHAFYIIRKFKVFYIAIFIYFLSHSLFAQDTGKYSADSRAAALSNTSSKNSGMKSLASFVLGNLWEETRKRLNLDNFSIKREEEENNKSTYSFNVKSGKIKISGKIPKKL